MSYGMYEATVPMLVRTMENLTEVLNHAEAFAKEQGLAPEVLVQAKLAEDMFPLVRQIQIASDAAKGLGARLAGVDVPSYEDNEATFEDMRARLAKTIGFLKGLDKASFDGAESRKVTVVNKYMSLEFTGADYAAQFALPNFFFHVTTAYAILRHKGVALGKMVFLGNLEHAQKAA